MSHSKRYCESKFIHYRHLIHHIRNEKNTGLSSLEKPTLLFQAASYFHDMYKECPSQYIIGGDYDIYAQYIKNKLTPFASCNIKCYFIFSRTCANNSFEFRLKIHQKILNNTATIDPTYGRQNFYSKPILVDNVIFQVVTDLGFEYLFLDTTIELVNAAKYFKCLLVTKNLNYCFYGVTCVDPKGMEAFEGGIECHVYTPNFCKSVVGVDDEKIPLFLTILNGNNIYLDIVLKHLNYNDRHGVLQLLSRWFTDSTTDEITKIVCSYLEDDQIAAFKGMCNKEINLMEHETNLSESIYSHHEYCQPLNKNDKMW